MNGPLHRPNIVFVFTDQQSAFATGGPGRPWLRTPAFSALAERGVRFERSYCAAPVCGPSRACLVTGRAAHETGVRWNGQPLAPSLPTLGQPLRAAGYDTAWAGKWHLPKSYPTAADEIPGFENLTLPPEHPLLKRELGYGWPGYALGANTDGPFVDEAIRYLDRPHDKPFFLAVSLHNPHDICWWVRRPGPLPPEHELPPLPANFARDPREPGFIRLCRERKHDREELQWTHDWSELHWRHYLHAYYRMTEEADREVGRLLEALEKRGLDKNTIVVFTSDHGEGLAAHQWLVKLSFQEEVVRVPLVVAGPGIRSGGRVDTNSLVSGLDLFPTFCEIAGATPPPASRGRSLLPLLAGDRTWDREAVVAGMSPDNERPDLDGRMVVTRRYKYCAYTVGPVPETLYDLETDPGELHNLAADAAVRNLLEHHRGLLARWQRETGDSFIRANASP